MDKQHNIRVVKKPFLQALQECKKREIYLENEKTNSELSQTQIYELEILEKMENILAQYLDNLFFNKDKTFGKYDFSHKI
jgi:hypothetical protein